MIIRLKKFVHAIVLSTTQRCATGTNPRVVSGLEPHSNLHPVSTTFSANVFLYAASPTIFSTRLPIRFKQSRIAQDATPSWRFAEWINTCQILPSESTSSCRLRPFIFLLASIPQSSKIIGVSLTLWLSIQINVGSPSLPSFRRSFWLSTSFTF